MTTPQSGLGGRVLDYPRGRTLGGSSAINAMVYIRGNRRDYDGWRDAGNEGWGYEDVLPYFVRSEDREGPASHYHGRGGPLHVSGPTNPHPLALAFIEAAARVGHRRNDDFNGDEQLGAGLYERTILDGYRHSTAAAFLDPIIARPTSASARTPWLGASPARAAERTGSS